jgi:uncharacterized membrane protein YbaN (DUF454 family)
MQSKLMPSSEIHSTGLRRLLQQLLIGAAGVALTVLGILGLLVPVMPGLMFLAGAVLCFSLVSPAFKARVGVHLFRQPGYRLARRRWNAGLGLPPVQRLRLAVWTGVVALARGYRVPTRGQAARRERQ